MKRFLTQQHFNALQDYEFKAHLLKRGGIGSTIGGEGFLSHHCRLADFYIDQACELANSRHTTSSGVPLWWSRVKCNKVGGFYRQFDAFDIMSDFIGMHSGNPLGLLALFTHAVADESALPWLGPTKTLKKHLNELTPRTFFDIEDVVKINSDAFDDCTLLLPEEPQRYLFITLCAAIAELYILFHEISHSRNSHTLIRGFDREQKSVLEFDADCGSVQLLLEFVTNFDILQSFSLGNHQLDLWELAIDKTTVQLQKNDVLLFAIVYAPVFITLCQSTSAGYPSQRVRTSLISTVLLEIHLKKGIDLVTTKITKELIMLGHKLALGDFNRTFPSHQKSNSYPFEPDSSIYDEIEELDSRWRQVYQEVKEVSKWGNPAPPR